MIKDFTAWAIDTRSTEGHGLIGKLFFIKAIDSIPPSSEGCLTALFMTRKIAREYLAKMKTGWVSTNWNPVVVKVKVTIQPCEA